MKAEEECHLEKQRIVGRDSRAQQTHRPIRKDEGLDLMVGCTCGQSRQLSNLKLKFGAEFDKSARLHDKIVLGSKDVAVPLMISLLSFGSMCLFHWHDMIDELEPCRLHLVFICFVV